MPETKTTVVVGGEYKESDDHVPDPTDVYAQFNTSGTGSHQVVEDVSPVFEVAKAEAAAQAAHSLDPDHPEPRSTLVLPVAQMVAPVDEEGIAERVKATADAAGPVEVGGPSPSEREAALTDERGEAAARAETEAQGGAGGSSPTPAGGAGGAGRPPGDKTADQDAKQGGQKTKDS